MKRKNSIVLLIAASVLALLMLFTGCNIPVRSQNSDTAQELELTDRPSRITSNGTGTDGMWYTFWTDGQGYVNMDLLGGGHYKVNWSNCGNFVCGKGWSTGSGRIITWSGSANGAQFVGVYGWLQNPLVEYYIPRSGGETYRGTYQADGTTWTLTTSMRYNKPSIEGTKTFEQYFAGGGSGGSINMSQHLSGWQNLGRPVGSHNYQVVATEGWGGSSGNSDITVGGTPTSSSSSSSSSSTPSGQKNFTLRARSTDGQGQVNLRIDNNTIATFTLGTSMSNYYASTNSSGGINVEFYNDATGRDVQIDYLVVNGDYRQAEAQSYNTAVYQNGSCGGSYSEWMHCSGVLGFGPTP